MVDHLRVRDTDAMTKLASDPGPLKAYELVMAFAARRGEVWTASWLCLTYYHRCSGRNCYT